MHHEGKFLTTIQWHHGSIVTNTICHTHGICTVLMSLKMASYVDTVPWALVNKMVVPSTIHRKGDIEETCEWQVVVV